MTAYSPANNLDGAPLVRVRVVGPGGALLFDDAAPALVRAQRNGRVLLTLGRPVGPRVSLEIPFAVLEELPTEDPDPELAGLGPAAEERVLSLWLGLPAPDVGADPRCR